MENYKMNMLSYNEIKRGSVIILEKQPYEVLEASHLFKGRGHSVLQVKIKNLITGNILAKTFHPSDKFEETELKKLKAKFLYNHRDKFFFSEEKNPSKRFELTNDQIGEGSKFLKSNEIVEAIIFENQIINIALPIKICLKVTEAEPGIKGSRSQPGTKTATIETGIKINTPLFVKEGDIIEINTETGEYVRRIQ